MLASLPKGIFNVSDMLVLCNDDAYAGDTEGRGKNSLEPREMHSCHHLHVSFPIQQNFVLLPKICAYV